MAVQGNQAPTISVVIPTYNREQYVGKAVESVLRQTHAPQEIIVVDDGSTDATRASLSVFGDRVRYIYQPNRGVSAARNRGIVEARCEWIAFLDSDDEWEPWKLDVQVDAINRSPSLFVHASNALVISSDSTEGWFERLKCEQLVGKDQIVEHPLEYVLRHSFFLQGSMLRRSLLLDVGMFDESMTICEDVDLLARLSVKGPWGVNGRQLVRVIRRGPANESLTHQDISKPVYATQCRLRLLNKIATEENLTPEEYRYIRRRSCAENFKLGAEYARLSRLRDAWSPLCNAVRGDPSIKSLVKFLLLIGLGPSGAKFISKIQRSRAW